MTPPPPAVQALGRSRGGLSTKLHLLGDGWGRELSKQVTPGQSADTRELVTLVDTVAVPRPGWRGRHRKRLDHLTGDRAYGSKTNRAALRRRGIPHTIPERADVQLTALVRDRSAGGPRTSTPSGTPTVTASSVASTGSNSSGPWPPGMTVRILGCRPGSWSDSRYDWPAVP